MVHDAMFEFLVSAAQVGASRIYLFTPSLFIIRVALVSAVVSKVTYVESM